MKIRILGTAAAECWPGIFCDDEFCRKIRQVKGKNYRSRAQLVIDDIHVIDFGYDNFYHSVKFDVDFSQIRDIFITHSHDDHFLPYELKYASQGRCAYNTKYSPITLYGNETVIKQALPYIQKGGVAVCTRHSFKPVTTRDGYVFTPILAEQDMEGEEMLNYIFEHEGKRVLYVSDSGLYRRQETWDFISQYRFDLVISECTANLAGWEPVGHQTYKGVLMLREKLRSMGCVTDDTPLYITHITHFMHDMLHEDWEKFAAKDNIIVCYDGIEIEI